MSKKWVKIGEVAVDNGQLLLSDPGYIDSFWEHKDFDPERPSTTLSYNACCHATMGEQVYGELRFPLGHPGAGICFESGIGDGLYPVYAKLHAGRVAEVKVVLLPHPVLGSPKEAFERLINKGGE